MIVNYHKLLKYAEISDCFCQEFLTNWRFKLELVKKQSVSPGPELPVTKFKIYAYDSGRHRKRQGLGIAYTV